VVRYDLGRLRPSPGARMTKRSIIYLTVGVLLVLFGIAIGFSKGWIWGAGFALVSANVVALLYYFDGADDLGDDAAWRQQ
jgi:hypothetical protein